VRRVQTSDLWWHRMHRVSWERSDTVPFLSWYGTIVSDHYASRNDAIVIVLCTLQRMRCQQQLAACGTRELPKLSRNGMDCGLDQHWWWCECWWQQKPKQRQPHALARLYSRDGYHQHDLSSRRPRASTIHSFNPSSKQVPLSTPLFITQIRTFVRASLPTIYPHNNRIN